MRQAIVPVPVSVVYEDVRMAIVQSYQVAHVLVWVNQSEKFSLCGALCIRQNLVTNIG